MQIVTWRAILSKSQHANVGRLKEIKIVNSTSLQYSRVGSTNLKWCCSNVHQKVGTQQQDHKGSHLPSTKYSEHRLCLSSCISIHSVWLLPFVWLLTVHWAAKVEYCEYALDFCSFYTIWSSRNPKQGVANNAHNVPLHFPFYRPAQTPCPPHQCS